MDRKRMEHLREVMIRVRDQNLPFDWAIWFRPADAEERAAVKAVFSDVPNPKPTPFCQTAACVLGHAAFDPEFNAQGLNIREMPLVGGNTKVMQIVLAGRDDLTRYLPFQIGMEFFDIDEPTADYLFTPDNDDEDDCTAAEDVNEAIRRIENVLAGYRPSADIANALEIIEENALEIIEEKEEADAI